MADHRVESNGMEITVKEIEVKPGNMLSLQRHRGRDELWKVEEGTLTVICDAKLYEVQAGQAIHLPNGSIHCMINASDKPVKVVEDQVGLTREADNVRLLDQTGRATYPMTTEVEFNSALIYAKMQEKLRAQYGLGVEPNKKFLALADERGVTLSPLPPPTGLSLPGAQLPKKKKGFGLGGGKFCL